MNMNRHEQREKAMITIYQYLLVERDIDTLIEDEFGENVKNVDSYFLDVIHNSIDKREQFSNYINNVLTTWTFDRLGKVEQAILLNGCSEFDLKQVQAAVIMDESVELAKKYCDEEAYKLINRVLDII